MPITLYNLTGDLRVYDSSVCGNIWHDLKWRNLVHVSTDSAALQQLLNGPPITFYCGFDPTAPSLHLGNLAQILIMRRLQLHNHRPLALVGGSTGLIGDPKPGGERQLNSREQVREWTSALRQQLSRFLSFEGPAAGVIVNNLDWTEDLGAIDFLREIGKHFRVNTMLKKDAVATRLASAEGISYTEFSYQILQALDFRRLYRDHGCVLQIGGSDQWGNITAGVDLIRKTDGATVHAFGSPLLTAADGSKFGKSEGNAIWLDETLTSPWAFYQFFLNVDDADIPKLLRVFTFFSREEIEDLERSVQENASARVAHRYLAYSVTKLVHGASVANQITAACSILFGDVFASSKRGLGHCKQPNVIAPNITVPDVNARSLGEGDSPNQAHRALTACERTDHNSRPAGVISCDSNGSDLISNVSHRNSVDYNMVDSQLLRSILLELPNAQVGVHDPVAHILQKVGLCKSLGEARRLIAQGGVHVNNIKVTATDATLNEFLGHPLPIPAAVLRKGKKTLAAVFYTE